MPQIGIIADIHMRNEYHDEISDELQRLIEITERSGLDHVFILGDLIEDGGSPCVDEANVERVRDILSEAPYPVTYLLGNHDVENLSKKRLSALLKQEHFKGVKDFGNSSVIYLDSADERTPGARGKLGREQREWLANILSQESSSIILCHHPLGYFNLSNNEWFEEYPERAFCSDRKEVLDVIDSYGQVRGTISGHIHQTGYTEFRGLWHSSINAFSKESKDKPITGTYAEVSIDEPVVIDVKVRDERRDSYITK